MTIRIFLLAILALSTWAGPMFSPVVHAEPLRGWQALRVIHQEGSPQRIIAADLDGSGREALIVVNGRQARLDFYRWLPKKDRPGLTKADPDRPNELPLAPEWQHEELDLEELPTDVVVHDLDHDGIPELIVLASTAGKVFAFRRDGAAWKVDTTWTLLSGAAATGAQPMWIRELGDKKHELLISCEQGILTLPLEKGSRASWLSPRESRGRLGWRLVDLDGDDDDDLIEWSQQSNQAIRWYECAEGKLLPAQVLHDRAVQGFDILMRRDHGADVLLLGGAQEGLLRRYRLTRGDEDELGRQHALPMPGGAKAIWCGMKLEQKPALVAVDAAQPRLRVHRLEDSGWSAEESYPTISQVRAIAAPQGKPGTLLLWVKEAGDLYESHWEHGRLTYPQLWTEPSEPAKKDAAKQADSKVAEKKADAKPASEPATKPDGAAADRRILALDTAGDTTWWAQRVGSDLDLYVWKADAAIPQRTRFAGAGTQVERVMWLGGKRLLVQQQYATGGKLLEWTEKDVKSASPPHLAKIDLNEFALVPQGGALRLARFTDGVLQWLGDDLRPTDQLMLPDGQRMSGFVPKGDGAWALEAASSQLFRLEPDDADLLRVRDAHRVPGGGALRWDPVLGLILIDSDRIVRISAGKPAKLDLIETIDSRVGRPSGMREATIHRVLSTDINGDGAGDVLLCDDRRHQLTALAADGDKLSSLASWQVFEDEKYPYTDEVEVLVSEPRTAIGCDADGDGVRDLALLCHDRLLIYLGREIE